MVSKRSEASGDTLMTPLAVLRPEAMEVAVEAESGQNEVLS